MHIALITEIEASSPRLKEIDSALEKCLLGYSFYKPLPTLYVIKTNTDADRIAIKDKLTTCVKLINETVYFVLTPSMVGGLYDGWLPKNKWIIVNEKTK